MHKNPDTSNRSASKKDLVFNESGPKFKTWSIFAAVAVLLLAAVSGYVLTRGNASAQGPYLVEQSMPPAAGGDTTITYPVSLFEDGQARFFEHQQNGMTIRYFILKSSDGVLRAAFDACDVCRPNRGYQQDGDMMVCRNCGRRFASQRINEVKGGCNPAPLPRSIQGDQLVIKVSDILQGGSYFGSGAGGAL